jgi:nucleotidyltransferase substrate binding protein (TIGR01987 family)
MTDPTIDLNPLERSLARLREGWARYHSDLSDQQIRDGLIQRFEFTYELSHRVLKRHLQLSSPDPEFFDRISFQDLIRLGNERGLLIGDWPAWRRYREMRSRSSLSYEERVALQVVECIPDFIAEVAELLERLQRAAR